MACNPTSKRHMWGASTESSCGRMHRRFPDADSVIAEKGSTSRKLLFSFKVQSSSSFKFQQLQPRLGALPGPFASSRLRAMSSHAPASFRSTPTAPGRIRRAGAPCTGAMRPCILVLSHSHGDSDTRHDSARVLLLNAPAGKCTVAIATSTSGERTPLTSPVYIWSCVHCH